MTMPVYKKASVKLKDGRTIIGNVMVPGEVGGMRSVAPLPHDPDVPSPLWIKDDDIESVTLDEA